MADPRTELRRYIDARASLGDPALHLPGMTRQQALALAENVRRGAPEAATSGGPASQPPIEESVTASGGSGAAGPASEQPRVRENVAAPPVSDRPPDELAELAREATVAQIGELSFTDLRTVAGGCTRCALHEGRQHVVFGEGNEAARIVCVGEAPGAVEDQTGRPFVGRAGQLLDLMLAAIGLRRDEVFICNVLKCRPPQNRNPQPEEIAACSPYLLRQIEIIDPSVVVAFGSFAAQTLLGTRESIGRLRGRTHLYGRHPLVVTYHPAASLRNPGWKRPTWEDLQLVRRVIDGDRGSTAPEGELALDLGG